MKYRTKPIVIEAIQYKGIDSFPLLKRFMGDKFNDLLFRPVSQRLIIPTLEGEHNASVNDWIIKDIQGEFYPCKPDIFKATYERVGE